MNFDFENYTKYTTPEITKEAQGHLDKLDSKIDSSKLTERELKFIEDVKKRIIAGKLLTDKQRIWLAKIIEKCH